MFSQIRIFKELLFCIGFLCKINMNHINVFSMKSNNYYCKSYYSINYASPYQFKLFVSSHLRYSWNTISISPNVCYVNKNTYSLSLKSNLSGLRKYMIYNGNKLISIQRLNIFYVLHRLIYHFSKDYDLPEHACSVKSLIDIFI